MKRLITRISLGALFCGSLFALTLTRPVAAESFELPQDPRVWVNGPPVSVAAMEGKAIVLYFFEESCPTCQAKWPGILKAATQMQGQPVMLIAVNSGTPPTQLARYIRKNHITIPVIVDTNRAVERAAHVPEISLKNIYQARIIDAKGTLRMASGGDIPKSLQDAANEGSWNVDPTLMTPSLIPIWKQIEFGNFAGTGKLLARSLKDRNAENKAAAEALQSYVDNKISTLNDRAASSMAEGDSWQAYKLYEQLENEFSGYELPESVATELAKLKGDSEIRNQIDAAKQWSLLQRSLSSGSATAARTKVILSKLAEKYPGTEAATKAQEMLGEF